MVNKKLKRAKRHGGISVSNYTFSRLQSGVHKGGPAHKLGQSDFISNNIAYDHETVSDDSPLSIIDNTTRDRHEYYSTIPRPYPNFVQYNHTPGLSRNQLNQHAMSSMSAGSSGASGSTQPYSQTTTPINNTSLQRKSTATVLFNGHQGMTPVNNIRLNPVNDESGPSQLPIDGQSINNSTQSPTQNSASFSFFPTGTGSSSGGIEPDFPDVPSPLPYTPETQSAIIAMEKFEDMSNEEREKMAKELPSLKNRLKKVDRAYKDKTTIGGTPGSKTLANSLRQRKVELESLIDQLTRWARNKKSTTGYVPLV